MKIKWFMLRQFIGLLCISILFPGCSYDPWEAELYQNRKTNGMNVLDSFENRTFPEFMVNGGFVDVFIQGTNETSNSGKAPYAINIVVWAKQGIRRKIIMHDIQIKSDLQKKYELLVHPPGLK